MPSPTTTRTLRTTLAVVALVPEDATVVTVTDFDEARAQLGVPELTGDDLVDWEAHWTTPAPGLAPGLRPGLAMAATADPSTGRIGWQVADPAAAARLTLTDLLPFAACHEVTPAEEPTGL